MLAFRSWIKMQDSMRFKKKVDVDIVHPIYILTYQSLSNCLELFCSLDLDFNGCSNGY